MVKQYKMTWQEFDGRCKMMAKKIKKNKQIKDIYGIPRGGLPIAVRLSHLTKLPITGDPKIQSTLIVDDCVDSGSTKTSFGGFKYFEVLVDKQKEQITDWLVFPWETK